MKRTPRRKSACRSCNYGDTADLSLSLDRNNSVSRETTPLKKDHGFSSPHSGLGDLKRENDKYNTTDPVEGLIHDLNGRILVHNGTKGNLNQSLGNGINTRGNLNQILGNGRRIAQEAVGFGYYNAILICILVSIILLLGLFVWRFWKVPKVSSELQYLPLDSHMNTKQQDTVMNDNDACHTRMNINKNEDNNENLIRELSSNVKKIVSANQQLLKEANLWRKEHHILKRTVFNMKSEIAFLMANKPRSAEDDTRQEDNGIQTLPNKMCLFESRMLEMPDFALESSGGSIVSTPYTETYPLDSWYYVLGVPLLRNTRSPRSIIQPLIAPGECWPFRGSNGTVVIKLAASINITAVTLEHIPAALSLTGKLDSAPQKFSIYGLTDVYEEHGVPLGTFYYNISSPPRQTFFLQQQGRVGPFSAVKLWIISNHGNPHYTCVYGFRVHGNLYSNTRNVE